MRSSRSFIRAEGLRDARRSAERRSVSQAKRRHPRKGTPASEVLDRITGSNAGVREAIRKQKLNVLVAEMIHDARTSAGLSQVQLAKLVGSTQSVISRLESADYEGHSLTMLQRIADALHRRLVVRMVPVPA
jgi:ribosome-binding protein aMBF1 (putative translation factor)